ncbi:MAG TPA: glycosyltransferase family 2 protein [Candidatus Acidoferrales bacterium]|nr:glycosyltransferase family 2 protein [Candidatus Acidoferrales bacterium]
MGSPKENSMLNGKKVVVVMPAYNAAKTLPQTFNELPSEVVDQVVLVDDGSTDSTVKLARELGIVTFLHRENFGYGRNQKTCYREALQLDADIVIMVHPDYQYSPRLIVPMAGMLAYGEFDVALGSRILGKGALAGGMPLYKYFANRVLTAFENILLNHKLSEYHTGYRAFTREVLEKLPLEENTDDFAFDNEMLAQIIHFGYRIGEISCPTRYFAEASSINFWRSVRYGWAVVGTSLKYRLQRWHLGSYSIFNPRGRRLLLDYYSPVETDATMQGSCPLP